MTIIEAAGRAKRGVYDAETWRRHSARIRQLVEQSGVRFVVEGGSALDEVDPPCIIVANHMSMLETLVLPSLVAPHFPVTFVVKRSLVEYPVFKHVMRSQDPIVVGRENPREDLAALLKGTEERAARGKSLIVFPQTTRSDRFDPATFNTVGIKMARRAGVPIVPLALKTDAWANGRYLKDFGRIRPSIPARFCFGSPITVTGNGRREHQQIVEFIQEKLGQWTEPQPPRA